MRNGKKVPCFCENFVNLRKKAVFPIWKHGFFGFVFAGAGVCRCGGGFFQSEALEHCDLPVGH